MHYTSFITDIHGVSVSFFNLQWRFQSNYLSLISLRNKKKSWFHDKRTFVQILSCSKMICTARRYMKVKEICVKLLQHRYLSDNAERSVRLVYVAQHESN